MAFIVEVNGVYFWQLKDKMTSAYPRYNVPQIGCLLTRQPNTKDNLFFECGTIPVKAATFHNKGYGRLSMVILSEKDRLEFPKVLPNGLHS